MADYVGRKTMMLWSVLLYALFSGLTAFSSTFVVLCALRFLTGLAMGSEWSTLLTLVLSIISTVGWWAISTWLPTFTVSLAKAQGISDAASWGTRISIFYTTGAIVAYLLAGFIVDFIGRRVFLFLTFVGALTTTIITYQYTSSIASMEIIAPINGFFTLGCAYVWMAIYPAELFTSTVRSTAISFVFNAARLIAWVFPIISGSMIKTFGGVSHAALTMGACYALGLIIPWLLPETTGQGMPE